MGWLQDIVTKVVADPMLKRGRRAFKKAQRIAEVLWRISRADGAHLFIQIGLEEGYLDAASEMAVMATENWPHHARFWVLRGMVHADLKEFEEAWRCYDRAHEFGEPYFQAEVLIGKAIVRARQSRFDEAVDLLEHPVAGWPDSERRLYYRAEFAVLAGQAVVAAEALEELREQVPARMETPGYLSLDAYVCHACGETVQRDLLLNRLRGMTDSHRLYFATIRLRNGRKVERCMAHIVRIEGKAYGVEIDGFPKEFHWESGFEVYVLDEEDVLEEIRSVIPETFCHDLALTPVREWVVEQPEELGVVSKESGYKFRPLA